MIRGITDDIHSLIGLCYTERESLNSGEATLRQKKTIEAQT